MKNREHQKIIDLGDYQIHGIDSDSIRYTSLLKHSGPAIYIIKCKEFYKIGVTTGSIEGRVSTLQVGNPFKLELVFAIKTEKADYLEKVIHNHFSPKRLRGEWFELTSDDFGELDTLILNYFNEYRTAKESR